jgi:hypothetical protein
MLGAMLLCSLVILASPPAASEEGPYASAESVVNELYDLVTFGEGEVPEWDRVRALFLPEAVIVLRTSREATSVFDVDGFIGDFVAFIENANVKTTGFAERIVRTKPVVFGDIASFLVLYTAEIPGSGRGPQFGVDSFQLVQRDGRWWIASIVNEIPLADRPVPVQLQDGTVGEAGVREAMARLSASTAPEGGGPDAYAQTLAGDFARWTVGSDVINDRDAWVEGMRTWWVDGWRVSGREENLLELSTRDGFAFTRRVVTETYVGPEGESTVATAALAEVWVQEGDAWKLLLVNVHPMPQE